MRPASASRIDRNSLSRDTSPMNQYEHSLIAMKRLLDAVGETHWAQWIAEDLELWRSERDTSHHLSAYGGMGSFNDVVISCGNEHSVTEITDAWANTLFEWLKSICHFLAKHPTDSFTAEMLAERVGRHDSALAALVGGDQAPASMRGYANEPRVLQGWRCLHCGRSEVSDRDIEYLMAQDLVPNMVFSSCGTCTLDELVDQTFASDIPGIESTRKTLAAAVSTSGILLITRDQWNWRCPSCDSDDTAVYRWNLNLDNGCSFETSNDNLPLQK